MPLSVTLSWEEWKELSSRKAINISYRSCFSKVIGKHVRPHMGPMDTFTVQEIKHMLDDADDIYNQENK